MVATMALSLKKLTKIPLMRPARMAQAMAIRMAGTSRALSPCG